MTFKTETERFLYEERKQMMEERDTALKALEKIKKESNFSVFMYKILDKDDPVFEHPTYKATMHISKDNHNIILTSDEIKDVVKCAGGNFKR